VIPEVNFPPPTYQKSRRNGQYERRDWQSFLDALTPEGLESNLLQPPFEDLKQLTGR
jgi:hypothetical protein